MTTDPIAPPLSAQVRAQRGRELRDVVPPASHASLPLADRPDPVRLLAGQIPSRLPDLVPLRHERMGQSPFTFYRGAAVVMASDLARTPTTGLEVQLCGDAHLSNFGVFGSPERRLVFDVNDFDETLPGPWEWDVKRLVASLMIAARQNGFAAKQASKISLYAARRYQQAMADFARLGNLAVWYERVDITELRQELGDRLDQGQAKRLDKTLAKARSRDHLRSLNKLTEVVDGRRRFVADPPLLVPLADLTGDVDHQATVAALRQILRDYTETLAPGHRELARSYEFVDMARKVVGVGSVGTRCWVVLLQGRDQDDPLFLQVKEAQESVLAPHVSGPVPEDQGRRVVAGQRIMQAAGDVFLGYQRVAGLDGVQRDFYVRQLQDWKGSADVDAMIPKGMRLYGELCAWTLARAHARSGDRIAIAAYLGDDDTFAQAVTEFAKAYADLNEQDWARFSAAVRDDEYLGQRPG
jgi:uncharacterized protein (DUF2252 family)